MGVETLGIVLLQVIQVISLHGRTPMLEGIKGPRHLSLSYSIQVCVCVCVC